LGLNLAAARGMGIDIPRSLLRQAEVTVNHGD
jgi:hypothetical protein